MKQFAVRDRHGFITVVDAAEEKDLDNVVGQVPNDITLADVDRHNCDVAWNNGAGRCQCGQHE